MVGIGLGRLLGREHASTPPEWGGGSSPVKNGASPDCIIVVVVVLDATFTHVPVHTWKNQALGKTSH